MTLEGIVENGIVVLEKGASIPNGTHVQVIVKSAQSRVRQTAGMMGWTGSQEDADFVAKSAELDPQEEA